MKIDADRILILGNSSSGKSTLARRLADAGDRALLDLDGIVWAAGKVAERREEAVTLADLDRFIAEHPRWVIEGCYATLIAHAASRADLLLFLNPGVEQCLAHNRNRPWEREKFASPEAQAKTFAFLQAWIAQYPTREDEFGLAAHRRVFEAFGGEKREIADGRTC